VSEGIAPCILNLGIYGGEWLASLPGSFIPGERDPSLHIPNFDLTSLLLRPDNNLTIFLLAPYNILTRVQAPGHEDV